jgi:hypothetical protein
VADLPPPTPNTGYRPAAPDTNVNDDAAYDSDNWWLRMRERSPTISGARSGMSPDLIATVKVRLGKVG